MISADERKSFTFTWILENVDCHWQENYAVIKSPTFGINDQQESKCHLNFQLKRFENKKYMDIYLFREETSFGKIDGELAILSKEGLELKSIKMKDGVHRDGVRALMLNYCGEINDFFSINGSAFLPGKELTIRCRIWKSEGEVTRNAQMFARTRICVRREVFLWNIPSFKNVQSDGCVTYHIKSGVDKAVMMSFKLILKNNCSSENSINILLVSENSKSIYFKIRLMLLNEIQENKGVKKEFFFTGSENQKLISLPFSPVDFVTIDNIRLPNFNSLNFRCECTFSTGDIFEEIVTAIYDGERFEESGSGKEENTISASRQVLEENLKSLFQDNLLSDVKLKTNDETFLAHKSILSARSPVFKAMFEHNMKEKISESVCIEDLDSNTVRRMLQYAYTADIEDLQFESACELYRAADKYQILALRDECAAFLKFNISLNNACETLIFAEVYQDGNLKSFAQDFIFDRDIITSDKWKLLMKSHVTLASDSMFLYIQRKQSDLKSNSMKPEMDTDIANTPVNLKPSNFTDRFLDNIEIHRPSNTVASSERLPDVHVPASERVTSSTSTENVQPPIYTRGFNHNSFFKGFSL